MVKPGGTGRPALVISARPAPFPPSSSFILPLPSALPPPKKYTYLVGLELVTSWCVSGSVIVATDLSSLKTKMSMKLSSRDLPEDPQKSASFEGCGGNYPVYPITAFRSMAAFANAKMAPLPRIALAHLNKIIRAHCDTNGDYYGSHFSRISFLCVVSAKPAACERP